MNSIQRDWWRYWSLLPFALVLALAFLPVAASAACSDSKVKRLSRQGKTVASIARTCEMDASDVKDILEAEDDDEKPAPRQPQPPSPSSSESSGLSSGTPLAACGCWGPVAPGHRQPNQSCRSGYAVPRMCPQVCPAGGYAWQGVCG